jgi:hypothetical protein
MKLTDKEESILGLIPEDDFFQNGKESILWTDVFVEMAGTRTGLSNQAVGGVLSQCMSGLIPEHKPSLTTGYGSPIKGPSCST